MGYQFADAAGAAGDIDWTAARADAAGFSTALHDHDRPARLPACPELDCIRHRLSPGLIAAAELRAAEVGVGADRALIAADIISEEAYLAALTDTEGFLFEPLDEMPRAACPLSDEQLIEAGAVGILPLTIDGKLEFVVAPRALAARSLIAARRSGSDLTARIRITTSERMQHFIARHGAQALAYRTSEALRDVRPDLSAGVRKPRSGATGFVLAALALILLMLAVAPAQVLLTCELALGSVLLAWASLRILGPLMTRSLHHPRVEFSESQLPTYTVVVALYREAAAARDLVAALRRLNYPGIMAQTPQAVFR